MKTTIDIIAPKLETLEFQKVNLTKKAKWELETDDYYAIQDTLRELNARLSKIEILKEILEEVK